MSSKSRVRSRSSIEHVLDLVEKLDEDEMQNLLVELNSTSEGNVQVSQGVEYFEEQRRARKKHDSQLLHPTPLFLSQPQEPLDWPRPRPRPVSGSQWLSTMRVVSAPYSNLTRHQTEPVSPRRTASPPLSPPLSASKCERPDSPRRSDTTPMLSIRDKTLTLTLGTEPQAAASSLQWPASPPLPPENDGPRPSPHNSAEFAMAFDGAHAHPAPAETRLLPPRLEHHHHDEEPVAARPQSRPLPLSSPPPPQPDLVATAAAMPLFSEHQDTFRDLPRLRTWTIGGPATTAAGPFKPRSFRRISRPVFLLPAHVPNPADALAERLSQYLFDDSVPLPQQQQQPAVLLQKPRTSDPLSSMDEMLREPLTPQSRRMFGRDEKELPSLSISEVLSEG